MKSLFTGMIALAFAWNLNVFANEPTAAEHTDEAAATTEHHTTETKVAKKGHGAKKATKTTKKETKETKHDEHHE